MDDLLASIRALARAFPHACRDFLQRSFVVLWDYDQSGESYTVIPFDFVFS